MDDLFSLVRPGYRVARAGDPDKQEPHRPCNRGCPHPACRSQGPLSIADQAVQLRDQLVNMPPTPQHPLPRI
jgi:hypothetical protein